MTGKDFDDAYTKLIIKDHKEDIEEFKEEAENGNDPDLKCGRRIKSLFYNITWIVFRKSTLIYQQINLILGSVKHLLHQMYSQVSVDSLTFSNTVPVSAFNVKEIKNQYSWLS